MSTLYVIRHAQASFGKENYDRLSELGERQAEILAGLMVSAKTRFDAIYTGTLDRHRQTAEPLVKALAETGENSVIHVISGLDEYPAEAVMKALIPVMINENPAMRGNVDRMMRSNASFQKVFSAVMLRWVTGQDRLPDVAPWPDFIQTVFGSVRDIMKTHDRGKTVAVFTSGGPIAAITGRVLGLSGSQTMELSWQVMNASVTRFRFGSDRISLMTFNEIGHLEIAGKQFLTYR